MKDRLVGVAALFSAALASICCIGPLIFAGLGLGSLGLAAGLTKYRPLFLGFTAVVLAVGFYRVYRKREVSCADGSCELGSGSRAAKAGLWVLTGLALTLASFPSWSARLAAREAGPASVSAGARTLSLRVSGMTCEACAVSIEKSVGKVPGVVSARVDFEGGSAAVAAEAGTDVSAVLRAVEAAGYDAELLDGEGDERSRS